MSDLKSCPFCSGAAMLAPDIMPNFYAIECVGCKAIVGNYRDEIDVINNWNSRATDAKYEKLLAFVKDVADFDDFYNAHFDQANELLKEIGETQ